MCVVFVCRWLASCYLYKSYQQQQGLSRPNTWKRKGYRNLHMTWKARRVIWQPQIMAMVTPHQVIWTANTVYASKPPVAASFWTRHTAARSCRLKCHLETVTAQAAGEIWGRYDHLKMAVLALRRAVASLPQAAAHLMHIVPRS